MAIINLTNEKIQMMETYPDTVLKIEGRTEINNGTLRGKIEMDKDSTLILDNVTLENDLSILQPNGKASRLVLKNTLIHKNAKVNLDVEELTIYNTPIDILRPMGGLLKVKRLNISATRIKQTIHLHDKLDATFDNVETTNLEPLLLGKCASLNVVNTKYSGTPKGMETTLISTSPDRIILSNFTKKLTIADTEECVLPRHTLKLEKLTLRNINTLVGLERMRKGKCLVVTENVGG